MKSVDGTSLHVLGTNFCPAGLSKEFEILEELQTLGLKEKQNMTLQYYIQLLQSNL